MTLQKEKGGMSLNKIFFFSLQPFQVNSGNTLAENTRNPNITYINSAKIPEYSRFNTV